MKPKNAEEPLQPVKRPCLVAVPGTATTPMSDHGLATLLESSSASRAAYATASLRFESSNITSQRDVMVAAAATVNNYYGEPLGSSGLQRKIADWLSQSPNYHGIQKETYEKAAQGTGEWFLQSPVFHEWVLHESGTLWGTGIPGAGKTYLASIIVNHLSGLTNSRNSHNRPSKPEVVVCVYCRYNDRLSADQILCSILVQLIEENRAVAEHVEAQLYNPCIRKQTRPTQTEILTELKHVLTFYSRVFVVVDALDELDDEVCHEVVQELVSLNQHLLMTSREIRLRSFSDPDFTICAPNTDFYILIERELSRFPKVLSLLEGKAEIRREIINEIEKKSEGMFLLAALQLATLKGITTIKSLRAAVANLPSTLNDMYQVTLNRINYQSAEEKSLAHRAILWATHAIHPLKVDELLVALSVDPLDLDSDTLDPESMPNESTVLAVCCGLVTFGKEDQTVRLVHFTAHDFITTCQTGILGTPHVYAASVCAAAYVQLGGATWTQTEWEVSYEEAPRRRNLRPFHEYAEVNLGNHICRLSPQVVEDIPSRARRFFQQEQKFVLCDIGIPSPMVPFFLRYWDLGSIDHFGALYGILPLIDISSKRLSSRSSRGYTPLDIACIKTQSSSITHILNHSSQLLSPQLEIERSPWSKYTLRIASELGCDSVVQFLLGQPGVDVNAKDDTGDTALHRASVKGQVGVIEHLLKSLKIDANLSEGLCNHTALHLAVINAQYQALELLLKNPHIQANAVNFSGSTALHLACERGDMCAIRVLLDCPETDINAGRGIGFDSITPLDSAVIWYGWCDTKDGQEKREMYGEVIAYLLERGAQPTEEYRSLLPPS